jgi:ABC-type transport system substrate-binding protein
VATACGGDDGGDDATDDTADDTEQQLDVQTGGKLVYGIDAESDGYNPQSKRFAQAGHTVASSVFDPLASFDEDGQVVPYLAESFTANDDYTQWTIGLRPDVMFHSNKPMDAASVVAILEAARTGLVTSSSFIGVNSVTAVDDLTVQVDLDFPWPDFPGILTTQAGYMYDPDMLTDPDSGSHPVGTGPFRFESWDRFNSFTVLRNDNYWRTDDAGTQLPYLEEIEFRIIPDASARNDALRSGDIDMLYTLTPTAVLDLRDSDELKVAEYNLGDEDVVALQTDDVARDVDGPEGPSPMRVSPFNNIHARLAVAYAFDQQAYIEEVTRGVNAPATGPWSPGQLGFREDNGFPEYDPDRAREEIELYKQDTGADALRFTYNAADDVDNVEAAQDLIARWEAVGMDVELHAIPQADIIVNAVIGNYEMTDWRNWGQPDPGLEFLWFHSSSVRPLEEGISVNITHLQDPEIDAALEAGRAPDATEDQRDEAYARVAARFGELVPYIFLGRVGWAMASREDVHGWEVATENGTVATVGAKTWIAELWMG